jgi:hypothetical protein
VLFHRPTKWHPHVRMSNEQVKDSYQQSPWMYSIQITLWKGKSLKVASIFN